MDSNINPKLLGPNGEGNFSSLPFFSPKKNNTESTPKPKTKQKKPKPNESTKSLYQAAANAASALLSTHESSELSINDPSDSTNAAKAAAKAERKQIKKAEKERRKMEKKKRKILEKQQQQMKDVRI